MVLKARTFREELFKSDTGRVTSTNRFIVQAQQQTVKLDEPDALRNLKQNAQNTTLNNRNKVGFNGGGDGSPTGGNPTGNSANDTGFSSTGIDGTNAAAVSGFNQGLNSAIDATEVGVIDVGVAVATGNPIGLLGKTAVNTALNAVKGSRVKAQQAKTASARRGGTGPSATGGQTGGTGATATGDVGDGTRGQSSTGTGRGGTGAASSAAGGFGVGGNAADGQGPGGPGDGTGGPGGDPKIVCSAMNQMYGFGSFRNAIWLSYADKHLKKEEWELGYHKLFVPLVKRMKSNRLIRVPVEYWARTRTASLRREMQGKRITFKHWLVRMPIEYLGFVVGCLVKRGLLKKADYKA